MGTIQLGTPSSNEQGNNISIPIPNSTPVDPTVLTESNVDSDGNPITIPDSLPSNPIVLTESSSSTSGTPIPIPDTLPSDPIVLTEETIIQSGSPINIPNVLPSDPIVLTDITIAENGSPVTIPTQLPADPLVLTDGINYINNKTDGFTIGPAHRIPFVNGNRDDFNYDVGFEYNMNTDVLSVENITLGGLASLNSLLMGGVTVDTIETTLTNDDTHLPTSGAVFDAIAAVAFSDLTGQVTSVGTATSLHISSITAQSATTVGLLSTDEFLINDGGVLRRMDVSVLQTYMQNNLTLSSYVHPDHTGQVLSTGDGATRLDISAITTQTLSATLVSSDEILLNDGGALRRMTMGTVEAYMQANLSFSVGVSDHGALSGLTDDDHVHYYNSTRLGTWVGSTNITTLGTITTGTWTGSVIGEAYTLPAQATHGGEFLTTDGTNTSWTAVAYSWFFLDGSFHREIVNADEITLVPTVPTYIEVQYGSYVGNLHTINIDWVGPTDFYAGWDPDADSYVAGSATRVGSAHTVNFNGSTYVDTTYLFTAGAPPTHDINFSINTTALDAHYAGLHYLKSEVYTKTESDLRYDDYDHWDVEVGGVAVDVINSGDAVNFASGTNMTVTWGGPNTITFAMLTSFGTMSSWNWRILGVNHGISNTGTAELIAGTGISIAYTLGGTGEHQATISSSATMVYPAAGIALSTGSAWGTSIANNSANWNTAYGWGDHAGLYDDYSNWDVYTGGIFRESISSGDRVDFIGGTDMQVLYSTTGNTLTFNWTGTSGSMSSWNWRILGVNHSISNTGTAELIAGTGISIAYTPGGSGEHQATISASGGSSLWTAVTGGINYSGGDVGIGTTTPVAFAGDGGRVLHIKAPSSGDDNPEIVLERTTIGDTAVASIRITDAQTMAFALKVGSGSVATILTIESTGIDVTGKVVTDTITTGGVTTLTSGYSIQLNGASNKGRAADWTATSDRRLKYNINPFGDNLLEKIVATSGMLSTYIRYDDADNKTEIGYIAQDLMTVFPEIVGGSEEELYDVSYMKTGAIAMEGVALLKAEIDELRKELYELKK